MTNKLETANFDYELPTEKIAQVPNSIREEARLLANQAGEFLDLHIYDLPELVNENDLLVVNKSRVRKARLHLNKETGGKVEVLVLNPVADYWVALLKPAKRVAPRSLLYFSNEPVLEIVKRVGDSAVHHISPAGKYSDIDTILEELGEIPLPPYIHTPLKDSERYQTVYSRTNSQLNSIAAPTAGLHLSQMLLEKIPAKIVALELAVGLATFTPIKAKNISEHIMHAEDYIIPASTLEACRKTKDAGGRVIAVGTTVVRALETAAKDADLNSKEDIAATSQLFIQPGFRFQIVDTLITNFHLPRSTLLVLLAAFMGDGWKQLYEYALKSSYRFLSFGDATFVEKANGPT